MVAIIQLIVEKAQLLMHEFAIWDSVLNGARGPPGNVRDIVGRTELEHVRDKLRP